MVQVVECLWEQIFIYSHVQVADFGAEMYMVTSWFKVCVFVCVEGMCVCVYLSDWIELCIRSASFSTYLLTDYSRVGGVICYQDGAGGNHSFWASKLKFRMPQVMPQMLCPVIYCLWFDTRI